MQVDELQPVKENRKQQLKIACLSWEVTEGYILCFNKPNVPQKGMLNFMNGKTKAGPPGCNDCNYGDSETKIMVGSLTNLRPYEIQHRTQKAFLKFFFV